MLNITPKYTDWDNVTHGIRNQKMIADVVGDYFFICPTNVFATTFASHGHNKIYYYFFTQRTSNSVWGEWMGVMHGDEISYVFGHPVNESHQYNARERDLSHRIMQAFSRFALTGKPGSDDENWPSYTKDHPLYYIFNAETSGTGLGPRNTHCAFWNEFMPNLKGQSDDSNTKECYTGPDTEMIPEVNISNTGNTSNVIDMEGSGTLTKLSWGCMVLPIALFVII